LSITTGSGNDVIDLLSGSAASTAPEANDLATVTRNAVINTGAGNDTVEAGLGDDTIDLGAGDDTLIFTKGGLTVLDTINGGAGVDTIILNTADTITKSEAENVSDIENFTMTAAGTLLQVSDRMVTSLTGSNTFTVNMGVGGNVVDLTQVTFSNTNRVKVNGTAGSDVVLVNDATLNAKATIAFGQDGFGTPNEQAGSVDTLVVIGNGTTTVTSDDFSNITGLDQLTLTSDSSRAQTFNITINSAMIDTKDSTDFSVGDTVDELVIYLDRNLAQGSVVNLDASALTASQLITIRGNSNVTVNVISSGAGTVSQVSSLEFTENADFLTSPGNATYTADSLDQLDHADVVNAQGTADTLQLKFAVANAAANLDDMFNNFSDTGGTLEAVYFNTNNAVQFNDITTSALLSGVKTVTTGNGDDVVAGNTKAATFNLGNGNNSYTSATIGVVSEKVNTGTGVDTFTFKTSQLGATDSITAGTGRDVLNLTDDSGMAPGVYALMTAALSGVDTVNYTVGNVNDGLTVNNAAVMQSEAGLQVNVVDNSGSNTEIIFDASAVTAGHSVTVSVTGSGSGFGNHVLPLWTTFRPDVIGGAGNDTITIGGNHVLPLWTTFRPDVIGGAGNDTITIGGTVSSYVVQGNAGADTIHITTPNAVGILFNSPNDGAASGSNTGYDVITGFTSGADYVIFDQTGFNIVNALPQTPGAVLTRSYDSAVIFDPLGGTPPFISRDALVMTHAGTGLTDAEIVDLSAVAARANGIGITALTNAGGIIVAQGQTQSAIYLFREEDLFQDNVSTHELKLLGVVDTNQFGNAAGDMVFA
ncbi:MAG: beta strand repeat-containing protein, partial [Burkholderiaceae bacterium]